MDEVRIGNRGSGHSLYLYPGQVSNAELTAVCDIHPDRIKWARENLVDIPVDSDLFYEKLREKIKNSNTTKQAEISTVLDVSETY